MAFNQYQKDEQTFSEEVTFYKNVFFQEDVVLKGDIEIDGNLKVGGSSGLKADALNGGEHGSVPYQSSPTSTSFLPPTNAAGRFLKSNGPGQDPEWVALGGGQGALDLDSLQDVDNDVANATNGQIIRYNSTTGKWERFTPNYLTAETSHADVVIDGDFTSEGIMKRGSAAGSYSIIADNSNNWNTAFGWGDHGVEGYIQDSDFTSNGFMRRIGAGSYTVDSNTYLTSISGQSLNDLSDVSVSNPTFGHVLKWTGSSWTAQADGGGGGGGGAGVDGAPAGTVSMWSGTAASVPTGYLLCDGSAINRVTYTDLFNAIGTAHGAGDGSTTFNLPNLRNRFVVGEGTSYALAASGGSANATLVSHTHTVDSHSHSDGSLSVDNHSHGTGNLSVSSHSHGTGNLSIGSHNHGTGNLSVSSHSHNSGNLATGPHSHGVGSLSTNNAGNHRHNVGSSNDKFQTQDNSDGNNSPDGHTSDDSDQGDFNAGSRTNTNYAGTHSHSISGNTGLESTNSINGSTGNSSPGISGNIANSSPSVSGNTGNSSPGVSGNTGDNSATISGNTGAASPATDSQGTSGSNANLPPYYALCYIIKVTSGGAITTTDSLTITSTDAGASAKPTFTMLRDSASPADNDLIGNIEFKGNDSGGSIETYVELRGKITDVTDTSEDSTLEVIVKKDGADKTITFPSETGTLALVSDLGNAFPSGGIIMWSGAENTIPSGWVLCNGSNSTPDLRNRFIVGAGSGSNYSPGDTGGSNDAIIVSHSHSINANTNNTGGHSHSGNTNNTGGHQHSFGANIFDGQQGTSFEAMDNPQGNGSGQKTGNTSNQGSHSHNINTNNAGDHSHNVNGNTSNEGSSGSGANRPPYYALCYIMKT